MASAARIVILDDSRLTAADRLSLDQLSTAVHPPGSPPNPVTAGLEWADATIRAMAWQEGRMVCHVGALLRAAMMDGRAVTIGGVGEVMTPPMPAGWDMQNPRSRPCAAILSRQSASPS